MIEIAILAGGCFWCTEAIYKRLKGVKTVTPGYTGGNIPDPTYWQVCSEKTGHAECVQIEFDPKEIPYKKILDVFWKTHDPTTLNRQESDVGTQYRSEIFYHSIKQKDIAERSKAELERKKIFENHIVTKITPFTNFYPAEKYHKDFYDRNRDQLYCKLIIDPKIKKLLKDFPGDVAVSP